MAAVAAAGEATLISRVVPRAGVEPARGCPHRFLRPTRLPFRHLGAALIAHLGEARQYHSGVRLTVAALLCLVLAGCIQLSPPASPAANTASTPVASFDPMASGPRFSQPPVTPPTPPTITLPGFACADSGGGKAGVEAGVTDVRVGQLTDFDRFVLQFDNPVPIYTARRQASPTFTMSPSAQPITLSGTYGVLVTVHTSAESATYGGSTDMSHGEFRIIKEARLTQDYQGTVSWALGLDHAACMRTFTLTGPSRLIVDFSTAPI